MTENLYEDHQSHTYIETQLCLHLAVWERGLLKWDRQGSYKNVLVFTSTKTSCQVIGLHK